MAALRRGEPVITRTDSQCRYKARVLGIRYRSPSSNRWTEEQIAAAKAGKRPEGKTEGAYRAYCMQHRIPVRMAGVLRENPITDTEATQIKMDIVPEGRTVTECRAYSLRAFGTGFRPSRRKAAERALGMLRLQEEGMTYAEIGRKPGLSRQRIYHLCHKALKLREGGLC